MSLKDALSVPIAFVALLVGILAVLVGLYGTAMFVAATVAHEWHSSWRDLLFSVGLLAGGIAVLDVLVNHWRAGKTKIGGQRD